MITMSAARFDWHAFSARFYPNRCRHDLEAIVAYDAYRDRVEEQRCNPGKEREARFNRAALPHKVAIRPVLL